MIGLGSDKNVNFIAKNNGHQNFTYSLGIIPKKKVFLVLPRVDMCKNVLTNLQTKVKSVPVSAPREAIAPGRVSRSLSVIFTCGILSLWKKEELDVRKKSNFQCILTNFWKIDRIN